MYFSYTLSMIPDWAQALRMATAVLAPHGALEVVDFGQQERLPSAFKALLHQWLARFDVTPVAALPQALATCAADVGGRHQLTPLYRGYAWRGRVWRD